MFKSIMRIIQWTGPLKKRIYLGFLFSVLDSIFTAGPVVVTGIMINAIYKDMKGISELKTSSIYISLGAIFISILIRWICNYTRSRLQDNVAYKVSEGERLRAGEILRRVPLGFFKKNSTGEINAILTGELSFFEMYAMSMIDLIANSYLFITIVVVYLFIFHYMLGAIALISLVVSSLGLYLINRMIRKKAPKRQEAISLVTDAAIEFIRGMTIIKSYNQEGMATKTYRKACEFARKVNISLETEYVFPESLHRIALYLGSTGILYTVTKLLMDGAVTPDMWIMLVLYSFVMFVGVENANSGFLIIGMVNNTLDSLGIITDAKFIDEDGRDIKVDHYNIEFKDVHFSYEEQEIIKGVSFKIPEKSTIALVGASGSGKTTLCNLIARFYDVDCGEIMLGGRNVKEFTCNSLLENITMVFQNVYLFNDTIRANICFGQNNVSEEDMINAAKKARCHDFIMGLPNGYDTVVGEGGGTLSGGEKQRISIARAMLKVAPIVILDEATASVDPENEYYIQLALTELTKDRTVITIAHRLKTIENADQILVIDDGRVIQSGTHNSLINVDGKYRDFVEIRKKAETWSI